MNFVLNIPEGYKYVIDENNQYIYNEDNNVLVYSEANQTQHWLKYVGYSEKIKDGVQNNASQTSESEPERSACTKTEFDDKAVKLLLDLYYERRDKFRNSTIKKKVLWVEISNACKSKDIPSHVSM
ncbi:hypothetical protein FQR65_LT15481 [Abscondita terminalis]|nr:hypothetical protein FQR65_LT15481 [Abscondita terminalis]